jgi:hypothetical protein
MIQLSSTPLPGLASFLVVYVVTDSILFLSGITSSPSGGSSFFLGGVLRLSSRSRRALTGYDIRQPLLMLKKLASFCLWCSRFVCCHQRTQEEVYELVPFGRTKKLPHDSSIRAEEGIAESIYFHKRSSKQRVSSS